MQTMDTVGVHVPSTHDEESETWLFIVVTFFPLLKVCKDLRIGRRHSRILSSSCILFLVCRLIFAHCIGSSVIETTLRMILPPSLVSRVDETNLSLLEHLYRLITYQPILAHGMVSSVMETILDLQELVRITTYQQILAHGIVSSVMKTISNLLELTRITIYQLILAYGIVSSPMRTIPYLLELIRITTYQLILTCGIVINVMKTIVHLPELFKITTYQPLIHDIESIVMKTIPDLPESLIRITIYQLILAYGIVSSPMRTIPYLLELIRITTYQLILVCGIVINVMITIPYLPESLIIITILIPAYGIVSSIVSSILYLLKHLTGLNTNRDHCVVISIARNGGSTTTSNVFCRNIDNSGSGEGEPFQLQKLENRSFWTNEEVTNYGLTVGCLLKYRDGMCCQSLLDGKQVNNTFVSRFLRNLHCPNRSIRIPPSLIWTYLQNFLFFNFLSFFLT